MHSGSSKVVRTSRIKPDKSIDHQEKARATDRKKGTSTEGFDHGRPPSRI